MRPSALERFIQKVDQQANGCWLWTAGRFANGYGLFRETGSKGGKLMRAHRWSYEHFVGPIPEGMLLLHSCDVRHCVRPDHLRVGTQAENMADMVSKGRQGRRGMAQRDFAPKLSMDLANAIRARYAAGDVRQVDLAAEFGISQTMVGLIVRGKRWA